MNYVGLIKIPTNTKEYMREYRKNHSKIIKKQSKEWRKKHPKYNKVWCKNHLEERKKQIKEWNKEHPKNHKTTQKIFAQNHPEIVKAQNLANYHILVDSKCFKCGSIENLEKHHPDYSKPLEIITLCRKCHTLIHNS